MKTEGAAPAAESLLGYCQLAQRFDLSEREAFATMLRFQHISRRRFHEIWRTARAAEGAWPQRGIMQMSTMDDNELPFRTEWRGGGDFSEIALACGLETQDIMAVMAAPHSPENELRVIALVSDAEEQARGAGRAIVLRKDLESGDMSVLSSRELPDLLTNIHAAVDQAAEIANLPETAEPGQI